MTMNAKLFAAGLGLLAAVAPAAAIAKTHHLRVHHDRPVRDVPASASPGWGGQAAPPVGGYGGVRAPYGGGYGGVHDRQTNSRARGE